MPNSVLLFLNVVSSLVMTCIGIHIALNIHNESNIKCAVASLITLGIIKTICSLAAFVHNA